MSNSKDPSKLPEIPRELLEALDRLFPESCPKMEWSDRQVWYEVGRRSVLRFLWSAYKEQNELED